MEKLYKLSLFILACVSGYIIGNIFSLVPVLAFLLIIICLLIIIQALVIIEEYKEIHKDEMGKHNKN